MFQKLFSWLWFSDVIFNLSLESLCEFGHCVRGIKPFA
jgi:hypothetical protein